MSTSYRREGATIIATGVPGLGAGRWPDGLDETPQGDPPDILVDGGEVKLSPGDPGYVELDAWLTQLDHMREAAEADHAASIGTSQS